MEDPKLVELYQEVLTPGVLRTPRHQFRALIEELALESKLAKAQLYNRDNLDEIERFAHVTPQDIAIIEETTRIIKRVNNLWYPKQPYKA